MRPYLKQNSTFTGLCDGYEVLFTAPNRPSFNGQEHDDEINGEGNCLSFKYRIEDSRLGRFLSVDPLYRTYPWNSNYAFGENHVINSVELEGLESWPVTGGTGEVNGPYINQEGADKGRRDGAPVNLPPVEIVGSKTFQWWRPKETEPVFNPAQAINNAYNKFDRFMREGGLGIWIRGAGSSSNPIPPSDRSYSKLLVIDADLLDLASSQFVMRNPISKTPFPRSEPDATMQTKQWDFGSRVDKAVTDRPSENTSEKDTFIYKVMSQRGYWQNNSYVKVYVGVDTPLTRSEYKKGLKSGKFKDANGN